MTGLVKYYIDYLIMTNPDAHREFKNRLYGQFARIGKALSSPHRLEILELLAQGAAHAYKFASLIGLILTELALDGATESDISQFSVARLLKD